MAKLIVDCQILQTAAYDRGMGKYSLSLLRAMVEANKTNKAFDELRLVFNANLTQGKRIAHIIKVLGDVKYDVLDLAISIDVDTQQKLAFSKQQLTDYIAREYSEVEDVSFLLLAPFFVGFASVFPDTQWLRKLSLVYDIIPYKIWHLQRIFPDSLYAQHFLTLMEADHLFTISNAVRDDMATLIGIPENMMTDIDGAAFDRTKPKAVHCTQLKEPYVLMNSAPIMHKNNDRAVKAFEMFNAKNDHQYTLFITSSFDDATKERLSKLSTNVTFLGNISDEELVDAYERASCLLFPSMAEGLGLPILEAVQWNIPIACSNIPVFSELSSAAFYKFDPLSVTDIANSLDKAANKVDWPAHRSAYREVTDKYTWQRASSLLLDDLRKPLEKREKTKPKIILTVPSPRLDTPGGVLGELLYTRLHGISKKLALHIKGSGDKRPSFAAYLQSSLNSPDAINVTVDNTLSPLGWLLGFRVITIRVKNAAILRCRARRQVVDSSLKVSTWQLYNNDKIITLDAVSGLIENSLGA